MVASTVKLPLLMSNSVPVRLLRSTLTVVLQMVLLPSVRVTAICSGTPMVMS